MKIKLIQGGLLCFLLYPYFLLAQQKPAPDNSQQPKSEAKTPLHLQWKSDDPNCDRLAIDGKEFRIIKHEGITVISDFSASPDFYAGEFLVINETKDRFDVDPAKAKLVYWPDANKPPVLLESLPPEKIVSKIQNRTKWTNALRALGGASTTTTTTSSVESGTATAVGTSGSATGTYSGTSTATTTRPDYEARRRASEQINEANERANNKSALVNNFALRLNTVFPKDRVSGYIYFPLKKFDKGWLSIEINGVFYDFGVGGKH